MTGLDVPNILQIMIATEAQLPTHPALTHVLPGDTTIKEHWIYVGDGSAATILNQAYPTVLGVQTGIIEGDVQNSLGEPAVGARVTAIVEEGYPMSQALVDDAGNYAMNVPPGEYRVSARIGNLAAQPALATVTEGATVSGVQLALPEPATITVNIADPAGNPVAGRVTVCATSTPVQASPRSPRSTTRPTKCPRCGRESTSLTSAPAA